MTKKLFTLLLAVAASVGTMFASVAIDGLNYNLNNTWKTAEVAQSSYYGDIVIPASVTYNSVKYSVTSIGDDAFHGCSVLTSVTIPNSVTSIGEEAFALCSGLTSMEIPNSVTSIGKLAFDRCTGLTSVTIGNSVTSIGDRAFSGCSGITSVIWNAKNCSNSGGFGSQVESFVFGSEVETIPASCCEDMNKLTSLTIPNTVTSIGESAFSDCSGLTSVTIGNSVTSIGHYAFYNCYSLTSVHISDIAAWCAISFADYDANPLYYAEHLYINDVEVTNLVIPEGVTSIGDYAFSYCSGLTSVTIPNSVTSIGDRAFKGCSSLTSIEIPNSVTSIGASAFYDCSSLTSVHISDIAAWCAISFADYDANPLSYAHNLYFNGELVTDLVIPEGVTSIGDYAFYGCRGLTSVTIPNSVTSIGEWAFMGCDGLTSIVVEKGNTVYDSRNNCNAIIETATNTLIAGCQNTIIHISVTSIGESAFESCSGLTSVTIPNSVTSIGNQAFYDCTGLTSVTIGNSVTSIGASAFSYCTGLTSVTIPNSVTSIGDDAFHGCTGLTSVTIEAETPPTLGEEAFKHTNNCPIYVPCNAVNAYKTAWSKYADRIVANCSSFTITFVNWDGSNLQTLSVAEGEMPQYTGSTPARPDDEEYIYTFSGWTPAIVAATEDATYTANYTATPKSQGINNAQSNQVQSTKVVRDGQIFILRGDKTYTLTGQEVQ